LDFTRSFGLRDNPFLPTPLGVEGVSKRKVLRDLVVKPLRLHEDPALQPLFVPRAGPFADHLDDFRDRLAVAGYTHEGQSAPLTSFAFLIIGKAGTGKSTLVNAMLQWLLGCQVTPPWVPFVHPPEELGSAVPPLAQYLPDKVAQESGEDDYCCIVIDDLRKADAARALRLWSEVTHDRTLILFLVTSEERILYEVTETERVNLIHYPTQPLTPDHAVEFVRARVGHFRVGEYEGPLAAHPLFPFDEQDVRRSVERRTDKGEVVTLRTLNVSINKALQARQLALQGALRQGFDIGHVSERELAAHVLSLSEQYASLVA
jgi:hypothetical protein